MPRRDKKTVQFLWSFKEFAAKKSSILKEIQYTCCIRRCLCSVATAILMSQHVQFLPEADWL